MKSGRSLFVAALSFCLVACATAPSTPRDTAYIALAAAYQGEFDNILAGLDGERIDRVESWNGVEFHLGKVHGYDIVVFKTGIGLTNAAMTTQLAFDHFPIAQVCWANRASCAQIRAISDIVGNDNPNEFHEFKAIAERNAGKLLDAVLASGKL